MTETFYDSLGVSSDATTEEIETAYREAIKQVHPDVSDDVDAGERTKRLNKAKRVLTDPDERATYDRLGHEAYTGDTTKSGEENARGEAPSEQEPATGRTRTTDDTAADSGTDTGARASDWADDSTRRETSGESTWRGSQQRGRRAGRRSEAHGRQSSRHGATGERAGGEHTGGGATDQTGQNRGDRRERRADGFGTTGRSRRQSHGAGATRSRADSTGPAWQTNNVGSTAEASGVGSSTETGDTGGAASPSAARQAAAGSTDGPNLEWSWNAWESTGAWAVRQADDRRRSLRPSRLFPTDQSMVLLGSIFFLYPFFVGAALYPPFPLVARLAVAVCTLLTFAYLLSIPEAAIAIFGLWSVLVPLALLAFPGVSLFSLAGVIGLTATWVPLGLSVLTFSLVRP